MRAVNREVLPFNRRSCTSTAAPAPSTGSRRPSYDHSGYREILRGRQDAVKLLYEDFSTGRNLGRHPTGPPGPRLRLFTGGPPRYESRFAVPPADGRGRRHARASGCSPPADEDEAAMT